MGSCDFLPAGPSRVPVVTIGCLLEAGLSLQKAVFVTKAKAAELARYRLRHGDVLFSRMATVGRAGFVERHHEGSLFNYHLMRLRLRSGAVSPYYFIYFVRGSEVVRAHVRSVNHGMTRDGINTTQLLSMPVPVAPREEQSRIVDAIESYISRLDAAVVSLERAQAKLKAYRASVLKAAVEGKLVPTEAELARQEGRAYEPAQVLLDRILRERRRRWEEAELGRLRKAGKTPKDDAWKAKYVEPEAPDTSELPTLPEGWCWATLDALISLGPQNGVYQPKSKYGTGTPILRIDDYQTNWSRSSSELQRVSISEEEERVYRLTKGDLVVNRVNSLTHLGKTLVVVERHLPAVFESNMMRFAVANGVEGEFVWRYLSSTQGRKSLISNAKWAVNQASINQQDVRSCPVPLPPKAEQIRIISEVDRVLSSSDVSTETVQSNIVRSHRLRQSILKWAFEGKLVDQDPNDEPADKLLERIRTERAAVIPEKKPRGRKPRAP